MTFLRRRLECQTGWPQVEVRLTADQMDAAQTVTETQILQVVEPTGIGPMPNGAGIQRN